MWLGLPVGRARLASVGFGDGHRTVLVRNSLHVPLSGFGQRKVSRV
jgi:hypothetical protein